MVFATGFMALEGPVALPDETWLIDLCFGPDGGLYPLWTGPQASGAATV